MGQRAKGAGTEDRLMLCALRAGESWGESKSEQEGGGG